MRKDIKLQSLKFDFQAGKIAKAEFISRALEIHRILFDYIEIVKDTDINKIEIDQDDVSFLIGSKNIKIISPPEEARVAPIEIMNFGSYEPQETRVMDFLVKGSKEILDVGANIGWFSIRFAKENPLAKVYAFEPMPVSYSFLQRNIAANGLGLQIVPYNYGLSEKSGSFDFFIAPTSGTNASLLNVAEVEDAKKVTGLTMTMDQWCSNQGIKPDFIKCDVEGAELLVFRGGRETLLKDRPVVFAELLRKWSKPFGYHPNDMIEFFRNLDYVCFAVGPAGVRKINEINDETIETNYAFVHTRHHGSLIDDLEAFN